MKKERLTQIVQNPNLIPGVYNYCDRWCERCPLTSRCANFAFSEEHFSSPGDQDTENARFWQKLHEVFSVDARNGQGNSRGTRHRPRGFG